MTFREFSLLPSSGDWLSLYWYPIFFKIKDLGSGLGALDVGLVLLE
jgi:hypothetical protein